ncbi:MAG: carbohydrate ABC transporter permease [Deinococcota bacterium]
MRAKLSNGAVIGLASLWLFVAGVPFYFMVVTAFKGRFELMSGSVFSFPRTPSWSNFQAVLGSSSFIRYLSNSVIVVTAAVFLILLFSALAAYVFARISFQWQQSLFSIVVAGLVIPLHVTLVPVYLLTRRIGLYDSLWGLLGPYVAFSLPLSIFILTEFMRQIPRELEEAARMDGASIPGIFWRIILPLSGPGLVTLAIYNAVILWNEFVFAFVLITSPENRPLPLAIWEYQGQYAMNIPAIFAVLTLSSLPLIVIYIVGQEKVIAGIMAGALK